MRPLFFIDTSMLLATLMTRQKEAWAPLEDGIEEIPLRVIDEEGAVLDTPRYREWKSAQAVLGRIRAAGPTLLDGHKVRFGKASLQRFAPGAVLPWSRGEGLYVDAHHSLELCIIPAPGAFSYSGEVCANLPVGQLTWVDTKQLHSAANHGQFPWVRLLVDVRKPDIEAPTPDAAS